MGAKLEHVNITVSDPARTASMLCAIFDWRVRWNGLAKDGGTTFHVGDDHAYVAVYAPPPGVKLGPADSALHGGLNHVGVLVDDLDATAMRVRDAGLKTFSHMEYEPGRRFYFLDHDGVEFEVVSYS